MLILHEHRALIRGLVLKDEIFSRISRSEHLLDVRQKKRT